jgi:hypothetical protein
MALFTAHHYRFAASASLNREQITKNLHDSIAACNENLLCILANTIVVAAGITLPSNKKATAGPPGREKPVPPKTPTISTGSNRGRATTLSDGCFLRGTRVEKARSNFAEYVRHGPTARLTIRPLPHLAASRT